MSTFFNLKKAFFEREHTKKNPKNAQAINQGVRGAEPPDAGKILKETVHIIYSKFPIFGVPGAKFLEISLFLLSKVSVCILLLY